MRFNPLIILSLGLCLSLSSWVNADNHAAGSKAASLGKMSELAGEKKDEPDDFEALGLSLCSSYNVSGDIILQIKDSIHHTMARVEGNKNPSKKEIVEFLNKHKNKLTCWGKHYLAKAFDEGVYMTVYKDLFKKDLYSKNEYQIDYNAVTITYNPYTEVDEPMTILDYIEKIALKAYHIRDSPDSVRNVLVIRMMIINKFGAKHFSELTLAEKGEFAEVATP